MIALLAVAAVFLVRFVMRRMGGARAGRAARRWPAPADRGRCALARARDPRAPRHRRHARRRRRRRRPNRRPRGRRGRSRRRRDAGLRACGLRRRGLRAHRQDDLHPHAGRQRQRRPRRPAPASRRPRCSPPPGSTSRSAARRRSRPTSCVSTPTCSTWPTRPSARSSACASTARWSRTAGAAPVGLRRGLAPRQAARRQPQLGHRRHRAEPLTRPWRRFIRRGPRGPLLHGPWLQTGTAAPVARPDDRGARPQRRGRAAASPSSVSSANPAPA